MTDQPLIAFGMIMAVYLLSLLLTNEVRRILLNRALLDHPNERSAHTTPTPRGGGWAIVSLIIPGMILSAIAEESLVENAGLICGAILLAFVSWLDDRKGASVSLRLSAHLFAACLGSLAFNSQEQIFLGHLPLWLDRTIMIIGWAWFINLTNFMDGIDGITSVETISIATGVCIVLSAASIPHEFGSTLSLLLTGACLGFLALNWYPARIFLGDVGSVPLGFLMGYLLILLAVHGQLAAAVILSLYYIADSGIVLLRRALRGEKVWKAHQEHFYQRAAKSMGRHDKVVWYILGANIGLIFAALLSVHSPLAGIATAVPIVAILLWTLHKSAQATS